MDEHCRGAIPMDLTTVPEIRSWLGALSDWRNGGNLRGPRFIKPFHLATLALTAKRADAIDLNLPPDIQGYAARMDLWRAAGLTPPVAVTRRDPTGRFVPTQALVDEDHVWNVTNELVAIAPGSIDEETRGSLWSIVHELVENCFAHSAPEIDLHGLACAQAWLGGSLAQIAIADPGIGVRAALSENTEYTKDLQCNNSCEFATRYSVSGKLGQHHSGYGLTLARDTLKRSEGGFTLVSQGEIFACKRAESYAGDIVHPWAGTLLVIEWHLDRPLDVVSVYNSWPAPEGASDEDFF